MCLLCIEVSKGNMTNAEVARAYREATVDSDEHWVEVLAAIESKYDLDEVSKELWKLPFILKT